MTMTRQMTWMLLMAILLSAGTAAARDSDGDSDEDSREIETRLSVLALDRETLRVGREIYALDREVETELRALVETYARVGTDGEVELTAWNVGAGPWEIRSLTYPRGLLGDWRFNVPADRLEELSAADVTINGNPYRWDPEHYEQARRRLLVAACVITIHGLTELVDVPLFRITALTFGALCLLEDEI